MILLFLFSSVIFYVFSENIRVSYFVLDENHKGFSLVNSVLQDKDVFECTANENCSSITKHSMDVHPSSSKWYKTKVALPVVLDCLSHRLAGETKSGVYPISINGKQEQIPCDMKTDVGGWTVFQRRVDGTVDFYRNWENYKRGFGDPEKNFWLGLDLIHDMISKSESEMRIDLTHYEGVKGYAIYKNAYVGDESEGYRLRISGYSGTMTASLAYHQNMKFSTYDHDNDISLNNCAKMFKSAFWFTNCLYVNPNGLYPSKNETGLEFITWFYLNYSYGGIVFIEMKFRRKRFGD